jgi:large subunit ribosomal protein L13
MKVIDATNTPMGRVASYVAKQALKGEDVAVVNCEEIIITGNKKDILEEFKQKKGRVGSGQGGPKYSFSKERIVKRTIRGMIPNHREGRGKVAFKRVKCYLGVPAEFENTEKEKIKTSPKMKFHKLGELIK